MTEVSMGVQTPMLRHGEVSGPGPWLRGAVGWDVARWIGVYVAGDLAFFDTGRAPPPPDSRSYTVWGLLAGVRGALALSEQWRLPWRVEAGAFGLKDAAVLATYGFSRSGNAGLGVGLGTGLEWRPAGRHFGLVGEIGVRTVSPFTRTEELLPVLLTTAIGVHYTL